MLIHWVIIIMTESISLVALTKGFRNMILHMLIEVDGGNYTGRIY